MGRRAASGESAAAQPFTYVAPTLVSSFQWAPKETIFHWAERKMELCSRCRKMPEDRFLFWVGLPARTRDKGPLLLAGGRCVGVLSFRHRGPARGAWLPEAAVTLWRGTPEGWPPPQGLHGVLRAARLHLRRGLQPAHHHPHPGKRPAESLRRACPDCPSSTDVVPVVCWSRMPPQTE